MRCCILSAGLAPANASKGKILFGDLGSPPPPCPGADSPASGSSASLAPLQPPALPDSPEVQHLEPQQQQHSQAGACVEVGTPSSIAGTASLLPKHAPCVRGASLFFGLCCT